MHHPSLGKLFFSFNGRISRLTYVLGTLAVLALIAAALLVVWATSPADHMGDNGLMAVVIGYLAVIILLAIVPAFAVTVKRLQDRNKSAAWLLPFWLVPSALDKIADRLPEGEPLWWACVATGVALTVWAFVELMVLKGTDGDNAYGPDPLKSMGSEGETLNGPGPLAAV